MSEEYVHLDVEPEEVVKIIQDFCDLEEDGEEDEPIWRRLASSFNMCRATNKQIPSRAE